MTFSAASIFRTKALARKPGEERFRSLFETAPCAWLVLGTGGEIEAVNSKAERLFGYRREELIGKPVQALIPSSQGEPEPWYRKPAGVGVDAPRAHERSDLLACRKDGSEFPVEIQLTTLNSEEGTLLSVAVTDLTERNLAAALLTHRASHDPLTGLPNRTLLLDRLDHALARARRSKRTLALMFLDLDDFKLINDTRGHEVGDQLLVALTPRLTSALRPGDTIARFGGDEFVVLCEDLSDDSHAIRIATRIADAVGDPVLIGGHEHVVTVSSGVVLVGDPDTATTSSVLRDADAAMYRAKAGGKGRIELFDERMRTRLIERIAIESSLRRAVARGGLRLFYQPVMSIARDTVVAMEALLRWEHPHRGLLEPTEFMHVAESTDLILQIGEWVIEEACRQAAAWRAAAPGLEPVRIAVNLSQRQLVRSNIAATVARVLHQTGLEPGLLELELTESMLLEKSEATNRALRELKALGVRLVLDDFGTEESSLGYLKRFRIDALKIDRSFVAGIDRDGEDGEDGAIVCAVLRMAGALDVAVTAEGVETSAQLSRLRTEGCRFAQGYLFSCPVPADQVPPLLELAAEREHVTAWRLCAAGREAGAEQRHRLVRRVVGVQQHDPEPLVSASSGCDQTLAGRDGVAGLDAVRAGVLRP
jgi:diguanylate cyclase (GGDEF)-like protein/PAS domain S-box-containing protein